MQLGLKVDVHTLRGMRDGVPRLIDVLSRHAAGATFYFAVGPDRRWLLPAADLGRRGADLMRHVRDSGFETGLRAFDDAGWQHRIVHADAAWIEAQMQRGIDRFADVFREPPRTHAAAGWRMSAHALRMTQRLGYDYASDGRGHSPHLPVWNAELIRCPQFPTTLPTLDELIGHDGITVANVAAHLLLRTAEPADHQVFTLSAEREGGKLAAVLEQLLVGWRAQGYQLVRLRDLYETVEPFALPRCDVGWGSVPGRAHMMLVQGEAFLAAAEPNHEAVR